MFYPRDSGVLDHLKNRTMLQFLEFFGKQKVNLKTSITKSYHWRIKQLDHLERMLRENKNAFCEAVRKDFEMPCSESICDICAPIAIIEFTRSQLREWVAPTNLKGDSYPEPYELSLSGGDSSGPLILLLNPVIAAISSGNPVVLKADNDTPATNAILDTLLPQYFEPSDVAMVVC
jgi:aldehyde dehydrogenase (NAD+)